MSDQPVAPKPEENQIIAERRAKLKALREKGFSFPNNFSRDHFADDLHAFHDEKERDWLDLNPVVVRVAGRIMLFIVPAPPVRATPLPLGRVFSAQSRLNPRSVLTRHRSSTKALPR